MRRVTSYVLIVLGLFLDFLSPLLRLYAYPRVHKPPVDNYAKIVSRGTGLYYSAKELAVVGPTQLENVKVARGNATAGSSDTAVYDYTSTTRDLGSGGGVINSDRERFVFDRLSAEAVHCCGETPRHEGRSEEHTSELQSQSNLVCRLLL